MARAIPIHPYYGKERFAVGKSHDVGLSLWARSGLRKVGGIGDGATPTPYRAAVCAREGIEGICTGCHNVMIIRFVCAMLSSYTTLLQVFWMGIVGNEDARQYPDDTNSHMEKLRGGTIQFW